jgi:hypothetical protein
VTSCNDPEAAPAVAIAVSRLDEMFAGLWALSVEYKRLGAHFPEEPGQLLSRLITGMLISAIALKPIILSGEHDAERERLIATVTDLVLHGLH